MNGALGVNLFFAISGYLITSRLIDRPVSLREFYWRRAFRILPPAFLYLATAGWLLSSPKDVLSCLLFLRNYWGSDSQHGWYTGHFWSLCVEEHFYLFWPALLAAAGVARARWIAPGLALLFALWRSLDIRHAWIAQLLHNPQLLNFPLRSDYRMDALLWGCSLALIPRGVKIPRRAAPWAALLALASAVALNVKQPQGYMIAQSLLFALILMATVSAPATWLGRLLESRPMLWLGRLSYSLYLWQQPFFSQWHHGSLQRFPVNLCLALGCAWLSYRWVERPAIRLGSALYDKFRNHEFGRVRTRVLPAPRSGNCRPELSLTPRANNIS